MSGCAIVFFVGGGAIAFYGGEWAIVFLSGWLGDHLMLPQQ